MPSGRGAYSSAVLKIDFARANAAAAPTRSPARVKKPTPMHSPVWSPPALGNPNLRGHSCEDVHMKSVKKFEDFAVEERALAVLVEMSDRIDDLEVFIKARESLIEELIEGTDHPDCNLTHSIERLAGSNWKERTESANSPGLGRWFWAAPA
jgi:hypothetical protein